MKLFLSYPSAQRELAARLALSSPGWRRVAIIVAAVAIVAGAGGLFAWQAERRAMEQAQLEAARLDAARRNANATSARELCDAGDYTVALQRLNEVARRAPAQPEVIRSRERSRCSCRDSPRRAASARPTCARISAGASTCAAAMAPAASIR